MGSIHLSQGRMPLWAAVLVAALGTVGCRQEEPSFRLRHLEGRIEKIDVAAREISVLYYSEERQEELIGVGKITDETEIMINGAVAKLSDLRAGDKVRGDVRIEKSGGKRRQIALRIHVERPHPVGGSGG